MHQRRTRKHLYGSHHLLSTHSRPQSPELWLVPNQEVRESRTSGSSTQTQKFETKWLPTVTKMHVHCDCAYFGTGQSSRSLPAEGSWALGTRMLSTALSQRRMHAKDMARNRGRSARVTTAAFLYFLNKHGD